ncbi:GTP-binding protein rhoA, partial [Penicillium canescens]
TARHVGPAGAYEFHRFELLKYLGAHVVLISFALDDPYSLDRVEEKWIIEVAHFCPSIPVILVGLKKDLRDDPLTVEELNLNRLAMLWHIILSNWRGRQRCLPDRGGGLAPGTQER